MQDPRPPIQTYAGELSDPTRWAAFRPRVGDIVVSTPPKAGTTWTQSILAMLIAGDPGVDAQTSHKSPWIDINTRDIGEVIDRLEAQTHRRQVKSHTPLDGLPIWEGLRYITIYRHPIDIHLSFRKHCANMSFDMMNHFFPDDLSEGFRIFLEDDHFEAASLEMIVSHYRATLEAEPRDNLLRLHYANMGRDLPGHVARIAAHVGIEIAPSLMEAVVSAATFDSMKANAARFVPGAGTGFYKSDEGFLDSGTSNKWEGVLTDADLAAYETRISAMMSPDERSWLEWGGRAP